MKNNLVKNFILAFSLILGIGSGMSAQNYFSKPEATKNLSDSAKYLSSTLDALMESNPELFKVNSEKLRFIKSMLKELKTGSSVAKSADKVLPKNEWNVLQPSVKFIDTNFANMPRHRYIRSEILFLISY